MLPPWMVSEDLCIKLGVNMYILDVCFLGKRIHSFYSVVKDPLIVP